MYSSTAYVESRYVIYHCYNRTVNVTTFDDKLSFHETTTIKETSLSFFYRPVLTAMILIHMFIQFTNIIKFLMTNLTYWMMMEMFIPFLRPHN